MDVSKLAPQVAPSYAPNSQTARAADPAAVQQHNARTTASPAAASASFLAAQSAAAPLDTVRSNVRAVGAPPRGSILNIVV